MKLLALLGCGLSIGWLIGLSASPVLQGVIVAIVGAAVAVIGVMGGISSNIEGPPNRKTQPQATADKSDTGSPLPALPPVAVMASIPGDFGRGVPDPEARNVRSAATSASPYPLLMILIGIAGMSPAGIVARTHGWFDSPDLVARPPATAVPTIPPRSNAGP